MAEAVLNTIIEIRRVSSMLCIANHICSHGQGSAVA